jgi:hypothetical protein
VHPLRLVGRALTLHDHDPARHLEHHRAGRRARVAELLELRLALSALGELRGLAAAGVVVGEQRRAVRGGLVVALAERLAVRADRIAVGAEEVVEIPARGVVRPVRLARGHVRALWHVGLLGLRLLLRGELGGVVERLRPGVRHVRRLAAEHVRLPVVELELSRGAHLVDRALRVLDVREPDGDLVAAGALDLRLGHAERVGTLPDRLDGVVQRLLGHHRHLRRGLALVDELDAALQVEAELRGLRGDDPARRRQQEQHDREDRQVPGPVGHRGLSTSRRPPSSS